MAKGSSRVDVDFQREAEREAALPVEVAVQVREGHTLKHDSPPMLPWTKRWTCTACGDPVMVSGRRIYGSATTRTCAESVRKWGGRR